jgi:hypothetical protein
MFFEKISPTNGGEIQINNCNDWAINEFELLLNC